MTGTASTVVDRLASGERFGPAWMQSQADSARSWLDAHGLPTARDESWKYTPIKEVLAVECEPLTGTPKQQLTFADIDRLAGDHGGPRAVFVDGYFAPGLSRLDEAVDGLVFTSLSRFFADDSFGGAADRLTNDMAMPLGDRRLDGFQMLNRLGGGDGAVILVDSGVEVSVPVHVVNIALTDGPVIFQPRLLVHAGEASSLSVIESFAGVDGRGLVNASTSITAGVNARVSHHSVQTQPIRLTHLAHTAVRQEAGSSFRSTSVMIGGGIARNSLDVLAAGDGTTSNLEGLYIPSGSQRHDNVVAIEHSADGGTSHQVYKGVIDDRARGSFSGHIIVDANTHATDAHQANHSVLLNPVAQSDSRPWLEIFADDVECTHGSAVGRLDKDSLFYLQSRGIPEHDARSMLIGGFISEIIDRVEVPSLVEFIAHEVAEKVSNAIAADIGGDH